MDKSKVRPLVIVPFEVIAGRLKQNKGPDDVCLNEYIGSRDRSIDVAFGSEMDHSIGQILRKSITDGNAIAYVDFFEPILRMRSDGRQRSEISGIGELIQRDDLVAEIQHEVPANGRTNKASSACHKYTHRLEVPFFVAESFFGLGKLRKSAISIRQNEISRRKPPIYLKRRVVPGNSALALRRPRVGDLIDDLTIRLQGDVTVSE